MKVASTVEGLVDAVKDGLLDHAQQNDSGDAELNAKDVLPLHEGDGKPKQGVD